MNQPSASTAHADVLLLTVTDVETRAVFQALKEIFGRSYTHHHIDQKIYYDLGEIGGAWVWLARSEMGSGTPGGALSTVFKAIDALQPQAVVMVGIAFGVNPRKQRIGDVLVARQLTLYDLQRVGTGAEGQFQIALRGDRPSAPGTLLERFRHGALEWPPVSGQGPTARIHFGLVLSGDKLVDHQDFSGQLLGFEREAIGGEMEGAGLYVAASERKVDWILVKAISDWADGKKERGKDKNQEQAARNAALFTLHTLQQGGFAQPKPLVIRKPVTASLSVAPQRRVQATPQPDPRRTPPEDERYLHIDHLVVDRQSWQVWRDGKEVRLTAKERLLLELFAAHPGQILTYRALLEHAWGPHYRDETNYIHTYVNGLRRKLEEDPTSPRYLMTEVGTGYRFVLPPQPTASRSPFPPETPAPLTSGNLLPPLEPRRPPTTNGFVGRTQELDYFLNRLSNHLAVITGMAGIGKTALAAALATRIAPLPSKIFWHTFHEDQGVDTLIWSLAGFLAYHGNHAVWHTLQQALQSGGKPPPSDVLITYLLTMLTGHGYVLCFDDFHVVDETPLLLACFKELQDAAGKGKITLIVTAQRLPATFDPLALQPLQGLTLADVALLLEQHNVVLDEHLLADLHARTEGNVQLLLLASEVLRGAEQPARLIGSLSRSSSIEHFLLSKVDQQLGDVERRVMGTIAVLLGIAAGADSIEIIGEHQGVQRILHDLSARSLLIVSTGDSGRSYTQHGLVGHDPNGAIVSVGSCPGAMSDPYTAHHSEFHPDAGWLPACERTLSHQETGRSDWSTIRAFYPWLSAPNMPFTQVLSGPISLPLEVIQIHEVRPLTPTSVLEDQFFDLSWPQGATARPSSTARAVLFQTRQANTNQTVDRLIDLGRPGSETVRTHGARFGDRLCVYDHQIGHQGCMTINPASQELKLASVPGWQPEVTVTPITSDTVALRVNNVPPGLSLRARLFPMDTPDPLLQPAAGEAPVIALVAESSVYTGTFADLAEPVFEGYIQVWVDEPERIGQPRRETVTDFALGGNPGRIKMGVGRIKTGVGRIKMGVAPVRSVDGQAALLGIEQAFSEGELFALQPITALPPPPLWAGTAGQAYQLTAASHLEALEKTSISITYVAGEVPTGENDWAQVYYWDTRQDTTEWVPLPTTHDPQQRTFTAPVRGPGIYTIMSSRVIKRLAKGWNEFAYPFQTARAITEALSAIQGRYTDLYFYDQRDAQDPWKIYAPAAPAWVSDLHVLSSAQSYLIRATEPVTLLMRSALPSLGLASPAFPTITGGLRGIPTTFYGVVRPSAGLTPTPGMAVLAWVKDTRCGKGQTLAYNGLIVYTVDVEGVSGAYARCGVIPEAVSFQVNGTVMPADWWRDGGAQNHDLKERVIFLPLIRAARR